MSTKHSVSKNKCSVDGCMVRYKGRGLCVNHLARVRRHGDTSYKGGEMHGMSKTTEYTSWRSMIARCYYPKDTEWDNYGGRGIKVCDKWRNSFTAFYEDMGSKSKGMTLERINTNGDYEPGNCRWATWREQANNKRTNRLITYEGKTKTVAQWSRETGIANINITDRLKRGWSIHDAFTTPVTDKFLPKTKKHPTI